MTIPGAPTANICCNPDCNNPVEYEDDECYECQDADEMSSAESYHAEGTWSRLCPHGDDVGACWACNQADW